jgi:quercetin dioxygenase-like cupin family protein
MNIPEAMDENTAGVQVVGDATEPWQSHNHPQIFNAVTASLSLSSK